MNSSSEGQHYISVSRESLETVFSLTSAYEEGLFEKFGLVIGLVRNLENCIDVWSFAICHDCSAVAECIQDVFASLPGGLSIIGFWSLSRSTIDEFLSTKPQLFDTIEQAQDMLNVNGPIIMGHFSVDAVVKEPTWHILDLNRRGVGESLTCKTFSGFHSDAGMITLRGFATFDAQLFLPIEKPDIESSLRAAVKRVQEVHLDRECTLFRPKKLPKVLLASSPEWIVPGDFKLDSIHILHDHVIGQCSDEMGQKKKSKQRQPCFKQDLIDLQVLTRFSGQDLVRKVHNVVPLLRYEKSEEPYVNTKFVLQPIALCPAEADLTEAHCLLYEACLRQLEGIVRCLRKCCDIKKNKFYLAIPYLFMPPELCHPLTVFYPRNVADEALEARRKSIHYTWCLDMNSPRVRPGNRYLFLSEQGPYLRNVHEHCAKSGVNASLAIVRGSYQYHHYMQDGINDNGWGCAYRSFQTIWSWFLLQGYTAKPVPSHREIQQALVDCGDRPANFVGTRQWIGSLELSYCLNQMLNITSKIMAISSGSELTSKARELVMHFETQGTPVMIGGGVLAHTILGVDFDSSSGEAKFLVLDPHYTDEEDIKKITTKGWCGWKPVTFWDQTAFYNLLLPQRPHEV